MYDRYVEGFKKFILRGNVVDLAVGIAIGAAFNSIVNSLVKDIITPLAGGLFRVPDFSNFTVSAGEATLGIGSVVNAAISFVLTALAIYLLIVLPMNKLLDVVKKRQKPADPTDKKCTECLSEIPIRAKRCAYCGQPQLI